MPTRSWPLAACLVLVFGLSACGSAASGLPTDSPSAAGSAPVSSSSSSSAALAAGTVVSGERVYDGLARDHVDTAVDYPQSPPVGGAHSPVWAACDGRVYDRALADENAVHSLEHGAVWITWAPDLAADQVETLHALVEGTNYRLGSPYPGQAAPVAVTAWGHQMAADTADDPRIATFVAAYTNGPQTPEPGATCDDPTGAPPDVHSS